MSEEDILEKFGQLYLCLIHPDVDDILFKKDLKSINLISESLKNCEIHKLINGDSWRERLLRVLLGMQNDKKNCGVIILNSLIAIRGISIVPSFAALAVLARSGLFDFKTVFDMDLDPKLFDNEVGWSIDTAYKYVCGDLVEKNFRGPNYGQVFINHVKLFDYI